MIGKETLESKRERLKLYLEREKYMLSPEGVLGYGVGSRNLYKYNTVLSDVQKMIKQLEQEIADLEALANGQPPRRAYAVVPRDW